MPFTDPDLPHVHPSPHTPLEQRVANYDAVGLTHEKSTAILTIPSKLSCSERIHKPYSRTVNKQNLSFKRQGKVNGLQQRKCLSTQNGQMLNSYHSRQSKSPFVEVRRESALFSSPEWIYAKRASGGYTHLKNLVSMLNL